MGEDNYAKMIERTEHPSPSRPDHPDLRHDARSSSSSRLLLQSLILLHPGPLRLDPGDLRPGPVRARPRRARQQPARATPSAWSWP
ncbi:MAG: hypothetical protein MZV64_34230 [Ignavibacteriales bacterium]|nr:hypothetical protein [Ignavibacteriales bacterium]